MEIAFYILSKVQHNNLRFFYALANCTNSNFNLLNFLIIDGTIASFKKAPKGLAKLNLSLFAEKHL